MSKHPKWVDAKRREEAEPHAAEVMIEKLRITVHRFIGCDPTQWFGTCHDLNIKCLTLGSPGWTLKQAKEHFLGEVFAHVERLHAALRAYDR